MDGAPRRHDAPVYPAAPWHLVGSLWLSVFRLAHATASRPAGIYGAAFVSYQEGSPLTYSELLVARPLDAAERARHGRRVTITDIWVDSPASMVGGRELWAIPKGLADFTLDAGPVRSRRPEHTGWAMRRDGAEVASARFADLSRLAPRTPFRNGLWQPSLPEGDGERRSVMKGTARTLPARARWRFAPDGPLGFLHGARQLASARMTDFAMAFDTQA